jgi:hypothetical protein
VQFTNKKALLFVRSNSETDYSYGDVRLGSSVAAIPAHHAITSLCFTCCDGGSCRATLTRAVTVQVEPPSLRAQRSNPRFRRAEPFRLADDLGEIDGFAALAMTVADSIRPVTALERYPNRLNRLGIPKSINF